MHVIAVHWVNNVDGDECVSVHIDKLYIRDTVNKMSTKRQAKNYSTSR
jgi:hypothetical protein